MQANDVAEMVVSCLVVPQTTETTETTEITDVFMRPMRKPA